MLQNITAVRKGCNMFDFTFFFQFRFTNHDWTQ